MSENKKSKEVIESTLYYFHSTGCAFCKKVDPIVDKLNKVLADYKVNLTEQDKLILNMNYYKEINASQIAKAIGQNRYYVEKRIEEMLDDLRNLMI